MIEKKSVFVGHLLYLKEVINAYSSISFQVNQRKTKRKKNRWNVAINIL
jgi:hypothetical protein